MSAILKLRIDPALKEAADNYAAAQGMTTSDLVRQLLKEQLGMD